MRLLADSVGGNLRVRGEGCTAQTETGFHNKINTDRMNTQAGRLATAMTHGTQGLMEKTLLTATEKHMVMFTNTDHVTDTVNPFIGEKTGVTGQQHRTGNERTAHDTDRCQQVFGK